MTTHELDYCYNSEQSLWGSKITVVPEVGSVRVTVKRNAYDFQSYVLGEVWLNEAGWTQVQSLPISDFAISEHSYVADDGTWEEDMSLSIDDMIGRVSEFIRSHRKERNTVRMGR